MTVDYDLVILGGTALARSIAALACRFQAQVALVEPQPPRETNHFRLLFSRWTDSIPLPQSRSIQPPVDPLRSAAELLDLAAQTAPTLTETVMQQQQQSLDQLAAAGVDVIVGQGEFHRLPRLGVGVNGRSLTSRAFLLAIPSFPEIPPIPGLGDVPALTLDGLALKGLTQLKELAQFKGEALPQRIAILGDDPQAIELAQPLQRLGVQVTLIRSRFLPPIDPQAVRLIQAQLEAEGVDLFTGVRIDRVEKVTSGIRLYAQKTNARGAGGRTYAIEADLLLLATSRQLDLASLNLESVGVKGSAGGVTVNRRMQTSHPRIYACGEALGGFTLPQLAQSEADRVLHQVLFQAPWLPPRTAQARNVPWTLFTDPQVAQVGLSEAEARRTHANVRVMTVSTQTIACSQVEDTPGFCTLILGSGGKILGGTIVSPQASEWVSILTLAIQQKLSMAQLVHLPIPSPTFAELLDRLTQQWRHQRFTAGQRTWLDRYFDLRRSWSS